jgi:hypothetical protein
MQPPGWVLGTIAGAMAMFVFMSAIWLPLSSGIKRLSDEVQGNLISTLGTAVLALFLGLLAWEKKIRDEWEPAVGGVLGCLLALLVAVIVASLQ